MAPDPLPATDEGKAAWCEWRNRASFNYPRFRGGEIRSIQAALKRSINSQRKGIARAVGSRVREVHRFVRDSYADTRAPADRLIVFDEAQRAWTVAKNLKKFGRNVSEPEMILEIMGRHGGWAVIVALVGGGQEIHGGESGLAAWGDAIAKHPEWEVITLSTPVENSSFRRLKIPQPLPGGGLQFEPVG